MISQNPTSLQKNLLKLVLLISGIIFAALLILLLDRGQSQAAPAADCSNGNFGGIYETEDETFSGDLYVTSNITIRKDITVTLEPSTTVTMCGAYQISVTGGGNLRAVGTEAAPITFSADDPNVNWNRLLFSGEANHSILRHVILSDGGGADPLAEAGTIEFGSTLAANPLPSPTLDHVTINDSGAYGLYLQVDSDDSTPPSITNVTIDNSASGAVLANAQALGGLGSDNNYTNNSPNTIQVIAGGASRLYRSQIWRNQGVPYELLGAATVAAPGSTDPFPTLTIDAGTTFLMHPDARLEIGTSLGRGASLVVDGTTADPVSFTRLDETSAPWDKLRLSLYPEAKAELHYADFSYGGSNGPATIEQLGAGAVSLDHVNVSNSLSAGLHAEGSVNISDSTFDFNQVGLEFQFSADAVIRNSAIQNNLDAGLLSLDSGSNYTRHCIDAIGNYWGSPDGPAEDFDQADACGKGNTSAGLGDSVSGGVLYDPWLPGENPLLDRGTIQPDSFYVVSDGVDETQVTIQLRDAQGNPLADKEVELKTTLGSVAQPASLTDPEGVTTAVISSTTPGFAYLSAYNLTDDAPIAGLGGVTFWQGSGDAGGLIDPGGAPFASPQLQLSGMPFQAGFPINMRMPMQNSNPQPVDVQVVYGISNLAVGAKFTPVYTATATLQPGESWDAEGLWLPTASGHHCIQAIIETSDAPLDSPLRVLETTTTRQKNTNQDPCNPDNLDPGPTWLKQLGGIGTVADWFYRIYTLSKKANECLESTEQWPFSTFDLGNTRDYQQVVTPPVYEPPEIMVEGELTVEQVSVLNDMAQTTADLLSLNLALGATAQRMNWAAQAIGIVGAAGDGRMYNQSTTSDFFYLDMQYQAYKEFANQYADKLALFADQIDMLLPLLEESSDVYMLAEEFQMTRDDLATNGFNEDERSYYLQTGLDEALISQLEGDLVASFDNQPLESMSFQEALTDIQASSRALATRLRNQYPVQVVSQQNTLQEPGLFVPPQVFTFEVGHPYSGQEMVELTVRPVSIPLGWTYELSANTFTLEENETAEATLTLYPDRNAIERDLVQITVEGTVDGDLVGGILMEYHAPSSAPFMNLYLPAIFK